MISQWHFQTKFSGLCSSKIVDLVPPVCRLRCNAQDLQLKWSHGMCGFLVNQGISQRKFDKASSFRPTLEEGRGFNFLGTNLDSFEAN
jgi:hypothetical protein